MLSKVIAARDAALNPVFESGNDVGTFTTHFERCGTTVGNNLCEVDVRPGLIDRVARSVVQRTLCGIQTGALTLVDCYREQRFGSTKSDDLSAYVQIENPAFYRNTLLGGSPGAAESYLRGDWRSDDLTNVFRLFLRNHSVLSQLGGPFSFLKRQVNWIQHLWHENSVMGSRKNIHEHYDLGNEFFSLFLDPTMMYSSALFTSDNTCLESASINKLRRVCESLRLTEHDHVLEIGSGWGSFAIYAARNYGCRVTTTTISEEQFRLASKRIREAGLSERVEVVFQDYRELTGQFDKLVSIEMIEAVGQKYLPVYFEACDRLVKPGGAMLIQAITMPEQRFEHYRKSVDFIQKYVFPGGFLPSVTEMQRCVASHTQFRLLEAFDFGMHYAKTLRLWNERFHQRLKEVSQLGFDDRFIRLWRYYLCYCEAAFLERAIGVGQFLWAKPDSKLGRLE